MAPFFGQTPSPSQSPPPSDQLRRRSILLNHNRRKSSIERDFALEGRKQDSDHQESADFDEEAHNAHFPPGDLIEESHPHSRIQWNPAFDLERPHTHHGEHLKFAPLPQIENTGVRRKSLGSASSHNHPPKVHPLMSNNPNDIAAMMASQIKKSGVVAPKKKIVRTEQVTVKDIVPGAKKLFKKFSSPSTTPAKPKSPLSSPPATSDPKKKIGLVTPTESSDEDDNASVTSSNPSLSVIESDDEDINDESLFDPETIHNTDLNTLASLHALNSPQSLSRTVSRSISSRRPSAAVAHDVQSSVDSAELSKKLQAEAARARRFETDEEVPASRFSKFDNQFAGYRFGQASNSREANVMQDRATSQSAGVEKTSVKS